MQSLVLPDQLVLDRRVAVNAQKAFGIRQGGSQVTPSRSAATSTSQSQIQFTLIPNNVSNILSRYMLIRIPVVVTVTGADNGILLSSAASRGLMALRQYPISSICTTMSCQLNNQTISIVPNQICHSLTRYSQWMTDAQEQSVTPILADQSQEYSDLYGSSKSPLNTYQGGGELYAEPRGSYSSLWTNSVDTNTQWVFSFDLVESIMLPPFIMNPADEEQGFAYINQLILTLTLQSNLSRIFSVDTSNATPFTSISVAIQQDCELIYRLLTIQPTMPIPDTIPYGVSTINVNTSFAGAALVPGASRQATSNTISLNTIPQRIFVWCGRSMSEYDVPTGYALTDSYCRIDQLNVTFNNQQGYLSSASLPDLFGQCVVNGLKASTYVGFNQYQGSVIAIDPVKDLGLKVGEAPGLGNVQLQIQLTVNFTNISGSSTITSPTIYIASSADGIMAISRENGLVTLATGVLTPDEVARASSLPVAPGVPKHDIYGGSFLDTLKNVGSYLKENRVISNIARSLPLPFAQTLGNIAEATGYGRRAPVNLGSLGYRAGYGAGAGRTNASRLRQVAYR